jgi:hypothetical protein
MQIVNHNHKEFNIGHFQGESLRAYFVIADSFMENKIVLPKDLSIVTCFNCYDWAIFPQQLDKNKIHYINKCKKDASWKNTDKIMYICQALMEVGTKYTLISDGNDVIINTLEGIIDKFKEQKALIVYNATKNNFPNIHIDKIVDRDWMGDFRYFNAGLCIGYTSDLIEFYTEALELLDSGTIENPLESEQLIIRHIFSKYTDTVKFDYECDLFQTFSQTNLEKIEEDKFIVL